MFSNWIGFLLWIGLKSAYTYSRFGLCLRYSIWSISYTSLMSNKKWVSFCKFLAKSSFFKLFWETITNFSSRSSLRGAASSRQQAWSSITAIFLNYLRYNNLTLIVLSNIWNTVRLSCANYFKLKSLLSMSTPVIWFFSTFYVV